jgi:hypothetical protein
MSKVAEELKILIPPEPKAFAFRTFNVAPLIAVPPE